MTDEAICAAHRKLTLDEIDDLSAADFERFALRECARVKRLRERKGVRFFACLVAEGYSERLSALLFYLVACTRTAHRNREPAHWKKTAKDMAKEIDASPDHVYRLLHDAKADGLLDYRPSMFKRRRCLEIWVTQDRLYTEFDTGNQDKLETRIGRFQPVLVELMGMNGSLLFSFVRYHSEVHDGCRRDAHGFKLKYPWMSTETIRKELDWLVAVDYLQRVYDESKEHPRYVATCRQNSMPNIDIEPPEELQTWAEKMQTSAEELQTFTENLQTSYIKPYAMKPHAMKPEPKSPQVPSPPPAAAKSPAVISPSAVEDDGLVRFASVFEEDRQARKRMEKGWKIPVEEQEGRQSVSGSWQVQTQKEEKKQTKALSGYNHLREQQEQKAKAIPAEEQKQAGKQVITPVVRKQANPSPVVKGAAAVPQGQQAKSSLKVLSGLQPQAARPAGTDGQTKSMAQPAASSLHRDRNGKLRPVKKVATEMEAGPIHEEKSIQPKRYEWAAGKDGRPVKVAVAD